AARAARRIPVGSCRRGAGRVDLRALPRIPPRKEVARHRAVARRCGRVRLRSDPPSLPALAHHMIIEVKRRDHVQRMTYDEFEARIQDGGIAAATPVRFDAVTGDEFLAAGELELYRALADPHQIQFRKNLTDVGVPIATALLVGFQIRVYLWAWVPGVNTWLQEHFTNWAPAVLEDGEVFRLFTYGLLHLSFTHVLFNLLFLAYTGWNLERAIGRANLVLVYFGSVFAGGLLSMTMAPERPSLGASGGNFGLLAAAVVFGWKH